ncbi:hypothetical protein [Burkholderia ubonensis]|uniref:hypothetical protein n=1 Tax=Burkholderia ubonensis TaxID=101571 RepID=UPI000AAB7184|nr:hypothetical protein [Burkholderia ubonensis]
MQDNLFDEDFGRQPGAPRPNYDEAQAEHKRDFENTPAELHEEQELRARAYLENPAAHDMFSDKRAAVLVDNPEDIKRIEQAAAEDAAKASQSESEKATQRATADATPPTPGNEAAAGSNSAGNSSPGEKSDAPKSMADGLKSQDAEKPTSLESTLATIRLSQERQQRFVISGDPTIERRFYDKLATQGKLFYQAGTPVITVSRAQALKLLHETAKEVDGASATHALSLQLDREGGGVLQNIKAGIANNLPGILGRRHEIDVVVVGKPDVVDAKLKELGSLVKDMEAHRHVKAGAASVQDDGKLVVKAGEPVKLDGTGNLYDVVSAVKDKVDAYNAQNAEKQQKVREFQDQQKFKDMESAKAKADAAAGKDGKAGPEAIHEHTAKVVAQLDKGFQDPNLLHANNGRGQVEAESLLRQARSFTDPTERKLQTLPDAERQKAIVQLAALVAKVDNKEFDSSIGKAENRPSRQLDKRENADTSTIREKVDAFVAMEAKRDPEFGAKAEPLLKDMVDRKILSEQQAEAITGRIAEAVTAAKEASKADDAAKAPETETSKTKDADKEASAQAPAAASTSDAPAAKDGGKDTPASAAPEAAKQEASQEAPSATASAADAGKSEAAAPDAGKTADGTPVSTESRTATDSRVATYAAAEGKAQTTDNASVLAAQSGSQAEAGPAAAPGAAAGSPGEPKASAAQSAEKAEPTAASTVAEATPPAPAQAADKPLELRDRVEALAKDGLANLTEKKADALVTDLDGIRSKPLSALDAGSGEKPTQTLVRAEALLKEVESGRFGPELQARAKDLSDALQKWGQQDAARLEKDGAQRDAVVSQLKSAEPALHAGAQASRTEAASTSAGAQQGATQPAAESAQRAAAQEPAQAPAQPSAAQVAREQAAQRQWETESAGAKLASLMANPPGSFTNRDKSWNEENIQRAAREVLRIDPESVSQLSAAQRTKIAAYSAWVADNARNGKLPGFSSEEGKAVANQLVERAAALIGKMDEGSKIPADVQKTLVKADNMVNTKEELQKTASLSNEALREGSSRNAISPAAANALANDMVHSVYRQPEVREAQVKYLLKNAANLTPEAIKSLEPQERAKTAVAMSHLAQQVRDGAMGEFSKLPSSVQKNVLSAAQAADNLLNSMSKDPAMRSELNQAYNELHGKSSGASRSTDAAAAKPAANEQPTGSKSVEPAVTKQDGRSLDR